MKVTAWCLAKFLLGDPPAPVKTTRTIVPVLAQTLLRTQTEEIIQDIMAGLSRFASDSDDQVLCCLLEQEGLLDKLFDLTQH